MLEDTVYLYVSSKNGGECSAKDGSHTGIEHLISYFMSPSLWSRDASSLFVLLLRLTELTSTFVGLRCDPTPDQLSTTGRGYVTAEQLGRGTFSVSLAVTSYTGDEQSSSDCRTKCRRRGLTSDIGIGVLTFSSPLISADEESFICHGSASTSAICTISANTMSISEEWRR